MLAEVVTFGEVQTYRRLGLCGDGGGCESNEEHV
jgi:hypothetical protein